MKVCHSKIIDFFGFIIKLCVFYLYNFVALGFYLVASLQFRGVFPAVLGVERVCGGGFYYFCFGVEAYGVVGFVFHYVHYGLQGCGVGVLVIRPNEVAYLYVFYFVNPFGVFISVSPVKQPNTRDKLHSFAWSFNEFSNISFPNFLKAAFPKFFATDFAITLPPAFRKICQ